jgi:hypothetical protein
MWIENEVMYIVYKQSKIDLNFAKEAVAARIAASKGKSYPIIIDVRGCKINFQRGKRLFRI